MSRILNPLSGSYQNRTPLTRYENEGNRAPSSTSSSGQYGFYYRVLLKGCSLDVDFDNLPIKPERKARNTRVQVPNLQPLLIPAEKEEYLTVRVSLVCRNGLLFVQLENCAELIMTISRRIKTLLEKRKPVLNPAAGSIVIAKFKVDQCFYRACVISKRDIGRVKVFFIDYGNTEFVDEEDILPADEFLLNVAPQAVRLIIKGAEKTSLSDKEMIDLLQDRQIHVQLLSVVEQQDAFSVRAFLWERGKKLDLSKILIGVADCPCLSPPVLDETFPGRKIDSEVVNINSRGNSLSGFHPAKNSEFCQDESRKSSQRNSVHNSEVLTDRFKFGQPAAINSSSSGNRTFRERAINNNRSSWNSQEFGRDSRDGFKSRAHHKEESRAFSTYEGRRNGGFSRSRFTDTGVNSNVLIRLEISCQEREERNSANRLDPDSSDFQASESLPHLDTTDVLIRVGEVPTAITSGQGLDDFQGEISRGTDLTFSKIAAAQLGDIKFGDEVLGFRSDYSDAADPYSFYVQLLRDQEFVVKLNLCELPEDVDPLDIYGLFRPCLAFYPEDETYYRAEFISKPEDDKQVIRFVDYGNIHELGDKKVYQINEKIPDIFRSHPRYAFHCKLSNVLPKGNEQSFSYEARSYFSELTAADKLNVRFLVRLPNEMFEVELSSIEGESVSEMFCKRGFAVKASGSKLYKDDNNFDTAQVEQDIADAVKCMVDSVVEVNSSNEQNCLSDRKGLDNTSLHCMREEKSAFLQKTTAEQAREDPGSEWHVDHHVDW
ncbi:unnamed protein product [Enterobius vermicularis]|uniref:Tudor domain-containing protein n=1 Tax=Enterobius vermicularis TaxID=51028 RepID=A0A0N4V810_ENTVE|nr:unnamed protein product [Enterobius vermicularis]